MYDNAIYFIRRMPLLQLYIYATRSLVLFFHAQGFANTREFTDQWYEWNLIYLRVEGSRLLVSVSRTPRGSIMLIWCFCCVLPLAPTFSSWQALGRPPFRVFLNADHFLNRNGWELRRRIRPGSAFGRDCNV